MSDTCSASLTLAGVLIGQDRAERLIKALRKAGANGVRSLTAQTKPFPHEFQFYECNYGCMDDDLADLLTEFGLSYVWDHGAGSEYGASATVYEAQNQTLHTQNLTHNGEPYVVYGQIDDADERAHIAAFLVARETVFNTTFTCAESAHGVLAHFCENNAPKHADPA